MDQRGASRPTATGRWTRTAIGPSAEAPPRWVFVGLAALIVVLGAGGLLARDVIRIRHDLETGQNRLNHLKLSEIDSGPSIEATLGTADRSLRAGANLTRDSIWLKLLTPIPKVGPQISAARVLSASAAQVADIAYQAALKSRRQLDAPRSGPADRLRLIDDLRQDLVDVNRQLGQVTIHTDGHLVSPLAKAKVTLESKLVQAKTQLSDGLTLIGTVRDMLAGPRTYLILAGNNAEMRSGGITTSAGLIHFQGGDLTTGQFVSSFDLYLPDNKRVPVPANLNQMFAFRHRARSGERPTRRPTGQRSPRSTLRCRPTRRSARSTGCCSSMS